MVPVPSLPAGKAYIATSADRGVTWSRPYSNSLPNPNAPFSTVTIDGQVLCAFNNSQTKRAPLALALSINDCKSWEPLAMVEEDPKGGLETKKCCAKAVHIVQSVGPADLNQSRSSRALALQATSRAPALRSGLTTRSRWPTRCGGRASSWPQ